MTAADAPELTTRDCKDWALAYADLAAKLAAAERKREQYKRRWVRALEDLKIDTCLTQRRADRAEAALVALGTYAHEATKAITELAGGGSELFAGQIGEMYKADLPFCTRRIRERIDRGHNVAANAVRKQRETEAALVAAQEAMRERCASVADKCAAQNKEQHVKTSRRASRLGADPFGHGEASHYAASELISCAAEVEAIAAMIRALPISTVKPEGE